ncbi:MAG: NYN domain-containing protein [Candidatus Nanoarchaeia archaeon]
MTRVAVYIDGCNFYFGLKSTDPRFTDFKFDFERYAKKAASRYGKLVKVRYYNASLKKEKNETLFKEQQQFFARLRAINEFQVILCKRQKRFDNNGQEYYSVKGDDIHLAIDMLKDAYDDLYDVAILISGDGDFAPVVRYVKNKGKEVENHHFENHISIALMKACNTNKTIDKKTIKKNFYRTPKKNK